MKFCASLVLITLIVALPNTHAVYAEDIDSELKQFAGEMDPESAMSQEFESPEVNSTDPSTASEPEPAVPDLTTDITQDEIQTTLTLMGRGIKNRKGEVIAVACVGNKKADSTQRSCKLAQHVYFSGPQANPILVGPVFAISKKEDPTNKETRHALRRESNAFKKFRWRTYGRNQAFIYATVDVLFGFYWLLQMTWTYHIPSMGVSPAVLFSHGAIVPLLLGFAVAFLVCPLAKGPSFSKTKASRMMRDQNGWNWSIEQKRVTRKTFDFYKSWLGMQPAKHFMGMQ